MKENRPCRGASEIGDLPKSVLCWREIYARGGTGSRRRYRHQSYKHPGKAARTCPLPGRRYSSHPGRCPEWIRGQEQAVEDESNGVVNRVGFGVQSAVERFVYIRRFSAGIGECAGQLRHGARNVRRKIAVGDAIIAFDNVFGKPAKNAAVNGWAHDAGSTGRVSTLNCQVSVCDTEPSLKITVAVLLPGGNRLAGVGW